MRIVQGHAEGRPSEQRTETFTGTVWADPVLPSTDGVTVNHVFFTPGARTHWHHHEHGQLLHVTAGSGLVCTQGEAPRRVQPGDVVWVPPGEKHWHGGASDSFMSHTAVSLGSTSWDVPVADREYGIPPQPSDGPPS